MNDNEIKLVDELVVAGLTRDWLVDAIETPDIWTIDRAIEEFREKVNDPFWEVELLNAMFERVKHLPTQQASLLIDMFMAHKAYNGDFYLNWLATKDFDAALPILYRLIAEGKPAAGYASDLIASYTIQTIYNGDLDAAMKDVSSLVASIAVQRIVDRLESAGDYAGQCRALAFPFSASRERVAWHMGRRHVREAVAPLITALHAESDAEAMRAMLWALGVLRDPAAADTVRVFVDHDNPLIAATAHEALTKIVAVES